MFYWDEAIVSHLKRKKKCLNLHNDYHLYFGRKAVVLFGDIKLTQCCKDVNVTNTRDSLAVRAVLHCTSVQVQCAARPGALSTARAAGTSQ